MDEEEKVSKKILVNCKEATLLSVIKEQKGLSLWQRFQLFFHNTICKYCKLWSAQSDELNKLIKKIFSSERYKMSEEKKKKLESEINELSSS